MARSYEKNVVCKIRPEELSFHGDKLKQTYSTLLSSKLVPGASYYATYAEFTEIPLTIQRVASTNTRLIRYASTSESLEPSL